MSNRVLAPALSLAVAICAASGASLAASSDAKPPFDKIKTVVVLYMENHSFDNMFGLFPGAEGLTNIDSKQAFQRDRNDRVYATLPPVLNADVNPPVPDPRFPANLANAPFRIDDYVPLDQRIHDLWHRFFQNQMQIDHGSNDKFALYSNAAGLAMGFYDGSKTKLWSYAKSYVLADHYFMGAFGGSFLNHQWLICACTPKFNDPPGSLVTKRMTDGQLVVDGSVTGDDFDPNQHYAVNSVFSVNSPHPADAPVNELLPALTDPTIGDQLSEKQVSWAWYSGGWNDAIAGKPDKEFQFHHQPFAYFKNFADGTAERREHLKDEAYLLPAIDSGALESVVFYKPLGPKNEHPGYADVASGDAHLAEILSHLEHSPQWKDMVVIVTFDENGGFWDHVPPPVADRWGPGTRVPAIILGGRAKTAGPDGSRGFVDHTVYDTTAILWLIDKTFGLAPLKGQRTFGCNCGGAENDLSNALRSGD